MVSSMPCRRVVPPRRSPMAPPALDDSAPLSGFAAGDSAGALRRVRISYADSRFTGVSYFAPTGLRPRTAARSSNVMAPMRQRGGHMRVRSTGMGTALSWSVETRASPTASWPMAWATSSFGLGTKVSAAVRTAFWSRGRVGAERVLDAIAELAEDLVGHIVGELRAKVHADALGPDDAHDLLDALTERGWGVRKEQVGLVEEEDELGLVAIAHLGQRLEELGEQPEEEARVEPRLEHELVGGENVHDTAPAQVGAQEIGELEGRLPEEARPAFPLDRQQGPLDGRDGRGADQAVLRGDLLAMIGHEAQEGAQVVEVEQEEAAVVGELEGDLEHARLGVVDLEHAGKEARPDLADGAAHGMPGLAVEIPEDHRVRLGSVARHSDLGHALLELLVGTSGRAEARHIPLHVRHEHGNAEPREALRQHHEGHRLAAARGARNEAVTVAVPREQGDRLLSLAEEDLLAAHARGSDGDGGTTGRRWGMATLRSPSRSMLGMSRARARSTPLASRV